MEKCKVLIEKDQISFSYYKRSLSEKKENLMNTNIISNNELTFSENYIKNNIKIVSAFLSEIASSKNITTINVKESPLLDIVFLILSNIPRITTLIISDQERLTSEITEKIIANNHITKISCMSAPIYLILELDKYGIYIETRTQILLTSSIMNNNNINYYSDIFYKVDLNIEMPLAALDEQDFLFFCQITKYLKYIHLNRFNKDDLDFLVNTLHRNRLINIEIIIHENIKDVKIIKELKKLNNKYKKYKIRLRLAYNDEYLKVNIFKQIIVNMLKVCGLLTLLIVLLIFAYIFYNNYRSMQNVLSITSEINKVVENNNQLIDHDIINNTSNKINALLTLNEDTVGWLNINDTEVNYPVVRSNDNTYYLDHNFNHETDYNGWIFMDYRNNKETLDQNTIIYGHNRYYSGVMFGTLKKVFNKDYFDDEKNHIINYNTIYGNFKWQIFSIYKIKTTNDYLTINFDNDEEYAEFINLVKNRSTKDFNLQVDTTDKILTLSTCADEHSRYVIHAVLKK